MATIQIDTERLTNLLAHILETKGAKVADLAGALCAVLDLDQTRLPMTGTSLGRVKSAKGTMVSIREAAVRSGAILLQDIKHVSAVVGEVVGIEPHLPLKMEAALVDAGVDSGVISRLYWDSRHGPTFRERMLGKWQTFVHIALSGKLINPTGFFVAAVRSDWHLSKDYEPGKKTTPKPAVSPGTPLPAVGTLVRVAGDSGQHRVMEHKWARGEWLAVVEEVVGGWVSEVEARKLRAD